MLLFRSISLEIFLLLSVQQLCAQEEYGLDSDDISEYNSEDDGESHAHPDYSKYFNVDAPPEQSSPLTGFVGSSEFSSFFAPQAVEYAGSNRKPLTLPPINFVPQQQQTQSLPIFSQLNQATSFPLKDFFEEARHKQLQQEQQQINEDYVKPGPNYISHQLPLLSAATANADEVERIPPRPNKPKKDSSEESEDAFNKEDEEAEKEIAVQNDAYLGNLNSKPFVNYNTGKSSSTVSQYPLAAGILDGSSSQLTPYQKYSFQPIIQASRALPNKYYNPAETFHSTNLKKSEPLRSSETQETENIPSPSHLKNHNCRKLSSSGLNNCFECVNEETQSKYTQCSYSSDKEPAQYKQGYSERYSAPARDGHYRYRRYTDRKDDPYYTIRDRSINGFVGIPEDYSAGFQYEPESYDESRPEVSYSEKQSQDLKKNPENCKKVEKDGSTCTVCKDPATGANFEQCSYTSAPSEKKYAFVKEKKYNSDDEPEETKTETKIETAPASKIVPSETKIEPQTAKKDFEPIEKYDRIIQSKYPKKRSDDLVLYENYKKNRDTSRAQYVKENHDDPSNVADTIVKESRNENKKSEDDESSKDFDEYHFKLFPELAQEESKNEETKEEEEEAEEEDYTIPAATKQNVEEVLAEFTKKDRSNCKKSEKNGMTCFLCVDKNKIQHEECMYVQESRPQSTHVAYHELKGIKKLENDGEQPDESRNKPILTEAEKTQFLKKLPESLETSASEEVEKKIPYKGKKHLYKKKRNAKKYKKKAVQPEPTIKTPTEFGVGKEEGAFSAETRPAESKLHGVQLPRYMVEKSEYEKEFDAFSGAL